MLEQLTSFINAALAGKSPKEIQPLFASCRLIALQKSEKKGDLRPTAIWNSLRRIIAKSWCGQMWVLHFPKDLS